MKRLIIMLFAMALTGFAANAQNYVVVNTETIFRALDEYNRANTTLDNLAQQYQKEIDDAFAEVERLYNSYMAQKPYLSEAARAANEKSILDREAQILERQEQIFGPEGELMQKRVDMIKPIQDKVFAAIDRYAQANGHTLVVDLANNPSILYYAPSADKTQEIIKLVK